MAFLNWSEQRYDRHARATLSYIVIPMRGHLAATTTIKKKSARNGANARGRRQTTALTLASTQKLSHPFRHFIRLVVEQDMPRAIKYFAFHLR